MSAFLMARNVMLIVRRFDTELMLSMLTQQKQHLQNTVQSFIAMKASYDPESTATHVLQTQEAKLNDAEKLLAIRISTLEKELEAIEQEQQRLDRKISQNTQREYGSSWSTGGQG